MKLSPDAIRARGKIINYLLQWRPESDKSQFLSRAGYVVGLAEELENDIRKQLLVLDAKLVQTTEYGTMYQICGQLIGPNGSALQVVTIWMIENSTGLTKFITLYPR